MLSYAEEKAKAQGILNIEFVGPGFLTYPHQVPPVDAVVTQLAIHYLPDSWKRMAIIGMASYLKDDGKLYLRDFIYSFGPHEYHCIFEDYPTKIREAA